MTDALPDWLWSPRDDWAVLKGIGRPLIFLGLVLWLIGLNSPPVAQAAVLAGATSYGIGLLGLRAKVEARRKGSH